MGKKMDTAIERLQRKAQAERPSDTERERVADQLLTQDQLRKIDKRLGKISPLPTPGKRKRPPSASPLPEPGRPQSAPGPLGSMRRGWAVA